MRPVAFELPILGWDIPGYGLMLMIGFMLAITWAANRALRSGANPDVLLNCGFLALIGGVVGSRAMFIYHNPERFITKSGGWDLFAMINVRAGGLEVYGGVLLAAVMILGYLVLWRHSIRWYMDIIVPSAALGMAVGRLGCFLNGCCWGTICDMPQALRFPYGSNAAHFHWQRVEPGAALPAPLLAQYGEHYGPITRDSLAATDAEIAAAEAADQAAQKQLRDLREKLGAAKEPAAREQVTREIAEAAAATDQARMRFRDLREQMARYGMSAEEIRALAREHASLPVHPTQIYLFVTMLLVALLLDQLYWRRTADGQVMAAFFVIEGIVRFTIEFIRGDQPWDTLGMTISQAIALVLIAVGLIALLSLRFLPARSPRARLWFPEPEPAGKQAAAKA